MSINEMYFNAIVLKLLKYIFFLFELAFMIGRKYCPKTNILVKQMLGMCVNKIKGF